MQSDFKNEKPKITTADFVAGSPAEMEIEILAGKRGLQKREITSPRIQKLGLALAGFAHYIHAGRVQIVGQSEIWYLSQLEPEKRKEAILNLDLQNICCILITKKLESPQELTEIADEYELPLLRVSPVSSTAISLTTRFLTESLAPQTTVHGVLLGMFGLGVMILGDSGIGKSECALDLISGGHSLVSDDLIMVKRVGAKLEGTSPKLTFEHLEIRGLGIVNVREIFGGSAIGKQKKTIDLCVELKRWEDVKEVERLGLDTVNEEIFGIALPKFTLPVSSGRNIATLIETAVRVHLLRINGYDAAQKLIEKHGKMLATPE